MRNQRHRVQTATESAPGRVAGAGLPSTWSVLREGGGEVVRIRMESLVSTLAK
jgi:hypothetical protein